MKNESCITYGDFCIWHSAAALALCLLMLFGLFGLIALNGLGSFWPKNLVQLELNDGTIHLAAITSRERFARVEQSVPASKKSNYRIQLMRANRDLSNTDFVWVDEAEIKQKDYPAHAVVVERIEGGPFFGFVKELQVDGNTPVTVLEKISEAMPSLIARAEEIRENIERVSRKDIGAINYQQEKIRLRLKALQLKGEQETVETKKLAKEMEELRAHSQKLEEKLESLRNQSNSKLVLVSVNGEEKIAPLLQVIRMYSPNQLGVFGKLSLYLSKLWEFVSADPRESNTEGGIYPAIIGTVMLVMIMTLFVTPVGILAAVFLREYARQGWIVSLVRIAVNNLAGVPSIVFGVFGVGFFIYGVGGSIDRLFYPEALPTPTYGTGGILWASLTLALLTVPTVIVATEEGLAAIPKHLREASYAVGATRFETTWRVVLPCLSPSILTGVILAVARAAGEVAPLMITGVVKYAPSLPVDTLSPFIHLERKFMHLGFHIFDVGFQSPNVDAARPMVYMTTLVLLTVVIGLNLLAFVVRNKLRARYATSAV